MFSFLKKKKRVNIIADRIRNLDDKLWLTQITERESRVGRKIRYFKTNDISTGASEEYRTMSLNTCFGERKIAINGDSLYYGNSDLIKDSTENSDWSFDFNFLFHIGLQQDGNVFIKFSEGADISGEEIDLAILEFELAVDSMYTKIVERKKDYDGIVDYLVNGV